MTTLNVDCLHYLFKSFSEEQDGCDLLYTCTLLNREWGDLATRYLYKDPWKYWLYQMKDGAVAKLLIDTYMSCYKYNVSKNKRRASLPTRKGEEEESPYKKIVMEYGEDEVDDDHRLPTYNYITFANNLHVPSLYQCVKKWYMSYNSECDENDENDLQTIYDYFIKIFNLFVQEANIKYCTFGESTEDDSYPITIDQLDRLVNCGKRVNLEYLNLGYFQCDSEGLSKITNKCNNLRTFKISAQRCSDEALARFIRSQNHLTKLKIRNAEKIDLTLESLGTQSDSLVKLRILNSNLESCKQPFDGIAACSKLRSIYMRMISWSANVTSSTLLMPIAKRCEFHNIDFSNTYLPADVLIEIAKKSSSTLRKVHLLGTDDHSDHEKFNLSAGIKALADHCKNIVHFERDIIPKEITSMIYFIDTIGKSLVRLEIESKFMKNTDSSRLIISISYCPKLEILNINYFQFDSRALERLIIGCKSLASLSICRSNSVNDDILRIIQEKRSGNLKSLDILACEKVTEDAVEKLRDETDIEVDY
ncbi:hypothetical protein RclHR1_02020007 [Rhizophagus clarus]|uniref:RNI-like protein n=1 Tax=Rhizophagus clarus TaxID=94130 RepID=A0A2Z6QSX5_9GLOM|nr:hypothetical protein RclHR1_02020007 [Rhizophagus clarus]GES87330.1 RNI-like protein [Rhizophagus clarus]